MSAPWDLLERVLCRFWTGHVWLKVDHWDAKQCVHCNLRMSAIEVVAYWRRHLHADLSAMEALDIGWPQGAWSWRRRWSRWA